MSDIESNPKPKKKTKSQKKKEQEQVKKDILAELDPEKLKLEKIILLKMIISKGSNASIEAMKELEQMSIEEYGINSGEDVDVGFELLDKPSNSEE